MNKKRYYKLKKYSLILIKNQNTEIKIAVIMIIFKILVTNLKSIGFAKTYLCLDKIKENTKK